MVVVGAVWAVGCGDGGLPGLVKVSGAVEYNGQPVTDGQVVFLPSQPGVGRQASGMLDGDGRFTLSSQRGGDGILPAEYDVVVLAFDKPPGEPTREELEALAASGGKWRTPIVPERYTEGDTTPLRETIGPDHSGDIRIVLED